MTDLQDSTMNDCIHPEDIALRSRLPKPMDVLDGELRFPDTCINIYEGL